MKKSINNFKTNSKSFITKYGMTKIKGGGRGVSAGVPNPKPVESSSSGGHITILK